MTIRTPLARLGRGSVLGSAAALLLLGACSSSSDSEPGSGSGSSIDLGQIQLQLTRADSCADLLDKVQASEILKLEDLAKRLRAGEEVYGGGIAVLGGVATNTSTAVDFAVEERASVEPLPAVAPPAADDSGSAQGTTDAVSPSNGDVGESGGSFSGTTVQVQDIDEADIVKTDGDLMYLLHGGTLMVLRAWPASDAQIAMSALVEGEPIDMFVRDGRAVVFSRVWGDLRAAGEAFDESSYYYSPGYTKLTLLDFSGDEPRVERESYVEGNYVSSRRHEGLVRAVVQDGFKVPQLSYPSVEYRDPFGDPFPQADVDAQIDAWLERTRRSILQSEIGDWLPREFEMNGGQLEAVAPRCGDYYAPDPGLTEQGVTSVVSLDMDDPAAGLGGATILGRAERVYANASALLLTQTDYSGHFTGESVQRTVIHRFDVDGAQTSYTASGAVDGYVHDQFSLDERDGVIRVSTTEENFGFGFVEPGFVEPGIVEPGLIDPVPAVPPGLPEPEPLPDDAPEPEAPAEDTDPSDDEQTAFAEPVDKQAVQGPVNRVVTLVTEGRELVQHGTTEDFGLTERIFATRFLGDLAYVVTFRQTDPLFVVDMSDDANPRVVGELHIPGFSNYLYPLGSDHLFAIGQDATDQGRPLGLALQIFDVSDPTDPQLAHRYVYEDAGFSPANVDHRAINFHADRGVVAFPFSNYSTSENSLEVFSVSGSAGIERLGGIGDATEVSLEQCLADWGWDPESIERELEFIDEEPGFQSELLFECRGQQNFRRGLFRDDVVYGISTSGVYAYDLQALDAESLGGVTLPGPEWDYRDYGVSGGVDAIEPDVAPTGAPARPEPAVDDVVDVVEVEEPPVDPAR